MGKKDSRRTSTVSVATAAVLLVAMGACGGSPDAPELLARPRPAAPSPVETGPGSTDGAAGATGTDAAADLAESVTVGGWYDVAIDPAVAGVLHEVQRLDRKGKRREAIRVVNVALEELAPSPSLHEARGALYASVGFRRGAAREFQRATELAPERASAWGAMGRLRQELGLATTAIQALERAHELGVDGAELHLSWARALRRRRERVASAHHYDLALARMEDAPVELLIEASSLYYEALGPDADPLERASQELGIHSRRGQAALVRALLEERSARGTVAYLRESRADREVLEAWTRVTLRALELAGTDDAVPAR